MAKPVSHKVFISYHHCPEGEYYRARLEELLEESIINKSVHLGDLNTAIKPETLRKKIRDKYLRDSSVTIVLVGEKTWQRKHVDWEISSSIRSSPHSHRSGLLGIFLPLFPFTVEDFFKDPEVCRYMLPPRLYDNVVTGFAALYPWTEKRAELTHWIHCAFTDCKEKQPDNSRKMFTRNRWGKRWHR